MRIAEIHLRAFGHFDDVRVDLDAAGPALHVVYGRNEAGKSTTRRALYGLFFQIPPRTRDAHRHPMPKLRIGARLVDEDGEIYEVVRRKGKKNTLLGPDDEPIDESVMRRLLAHVGEEQFEVMFGLDHVSLREGATALLASGGDVGESIYGASLGGGIHEVIAKLEEEAKALFAPRGRNPELNAAIAEYDEAKSRLRDAGFTAEGYESQIAALEEARRELATLRERRDGLYAEMGRVSRAVRVMPNLAKLGRLREERRALETPGSLAEVVPEVLEELRQGLHVLLKSNRDLPNREHEREEARGRAAAILSKLGAEQDLEAGRALLPSAEARDGLRRLIEGHGKVVADVDNARENLELKLAERDSLEDDEGVPVEDLTPVEAALSAARPLGDAPGELAALAAEIEELAEAADRRASALPGFSGRAADAARLAVPDRETVARDADARQARASAAKRAEDEVKRVQRRLHSIESAITAEEERGAVPSEGDLSRQRKDRDRMWAAFRRSMESSSGGDDSLGLDAVDPDRYEGAVAAADETADVMRREADRVAEQAQRRSERREVAVELERAESDAAEAAQALAAHDEATRERWAAIGVEAADAEAMRRWLTQHAEALQAWEAIETKRRERAALEARVKASIAALSSALDSTETSLSVLTQMAEDRVEAAREQRARSEERLERRKAVEAELAQLEKRLEHRQAALDAWRQDWGGRVAGLGLDADAPPRHVSEVLESLNELAKEIASADDEQERIEKMHADAERFEAEVDALIGAHADDLQGRPLPERGAALIERIAAAHARAAEARRLDEAIEALREEILDAGDGKALEELAAETEGLDLGQQRGRQSEIGDEIKELNDEIGAADRNVTTLELGVERFRERTSAAEAADDAQEVLARIRQSAHRYVRLRLAREVLRTEIARYRDENQGPILEKANLLFPRLTRGAYSALKVVTGDGDEPVLSCIRADREEVGVEGLSDGTKDQLYLALRLASLLHFTEHNTPLPLILDDCLVHFDDDRARAALEVLGEVSKSFQILFFTHHRRLVELAREAVPKDRLHVSDLGELRARAEEARA